MTLLRKASSDGHHAEFPDTRRKVSTLPSRLIQESSALTNQFGPATSSTNSTFLERKNF